MLLATSVQMMPDISVVWLLGIFLCAVALLTFFVFRPVLRIIDRRKDLTDGVVDRSQDIENAARELDAHMEEGFEKTRAEGTELRLQLRSEAEQSALAMVEEGQVERDLILARARDDQARLRTAMSIELASGADELAGLIEDHALILKKEGS
jgi:F-type H+-transporting ATPase subunit b